MNICSEHDEIGRWNWWWNDEILGINEHRDYLCNCDEIKSISPSRRWFRRFHDQFMK